LRDDNALGSQRDSMGRSMGRHAHIIPTLVSTELQVAAGGLSYVESLEFEIATSDCRRKMDTIQTLRSTVSAEIVTAEGTSGSTG
jgi:hypothetical protein